jgi:cell division protein FtsQ
MQKQKSTTDWKKMGYALLWVALILVFIATVGFTSSRERQQHFTGLETVVTDSTGHSFVTISDLRQMIESKYGDITLKQRGSINTSLLESILLNNPFIAAVKVFSTIDGKLHVEVVQRDPLARVINFNHESFYIDGTGRLMPVSEKYTARVPVVNGYIFNREAEQHVRLYSVEELEDTSIAIPRLSQVFSVVEFIHNDSFWNAQIVQVFVNPNGDLELIPRVGDHTVILGDVHDLTKKFDKLYHFYKNGLNNTGWRKYKTINLKFQDQIVCTKR